MQNESIKKEENQKSNGPPHLVRVLLWWSALSAILYLAHVGSRYYLLGSEEERNAREASNAAFTVAEVLSKKRNYYVAHGSDKASLDVRKLEEACKDVPGAVKEFRGKVTPAYEAALTVANNECQDLLRKAVADQDGLSPEVVNVSIARIETAVSIAGKPDNDRREELHRQETEAKLRKVLDETAAQRTQK